MGDEEKFIVNEYYCCSAMEVHPACDQVHRYGFWLLNWSRLPFVLVGHSFSQPC